MGENIMRVDAGVARRLAVEHRDGGKFLAATGAWTAAHAHDINVLISECLPAMQSRSTLILDMQDVTEFDTYGAWLVEYLVDEAQLNEVTIDIANMPARFVPLSRSVHDALARQDRNKKTVSGHDWKSWLQIVTRTAGSLGRDLLAIMNLLGAVASVVGAIVMGKTSFRATSTVHQLDRVAWQAVPIVMLITFLIGGIIAQQGFFHFRKFGADQYVVDMVGILVLREIGVLLVAIMVAGRSGSSYTAELGSMKMREELDALRTMGLDPVAVLILPRILALVIALPALTFLGSMAALYGGGLVAWLYGDMNPDIYISRLRDAISITHFKVGIIKAPFMALIIGLVACVEGLRVRGSAESLGLQTTSSVVKSIFLVIVLDGLFAIYFAAIGM
jgi:phospholipid/cholesterol/gamma-HCH transport system permease protein